MRLMVGIYLDQHVAMNVLASFNTTMCFRVREGFVPQEEQPVYLSRGALVSTERKAIIIGISYNDDRD